jgi:hypothetical protein
MASARRKPSRSRKLLGDAEARESSKACQGWVERYGQDFRTAQSCGKQLARLRGARGSGGYGDTYGSTIESCARALSDIIKRDGREGVSAVASCVRRGYGHGVQQVSWPTQKRMTAAQARAREQSRWAHEMARKFDRKY